MLHVSKLIDILKAALIIGASLVILGSDYRLFFKNLCKRRVLRSAYELVRLIKATYLLKTVVRKNILDRFLHRLVLTL